MSMQRALLKKGERGGKDTIKVTYVFSVAKVLTKCGFRYCTKCETNTNYELRSKALALKTICAYRKFYI